MLIQFFGTLRSCWTMIALFILVLLSWLGLIILKQIFFINDGHSVILFIQILWYCFACGLLISSTLSVMFGGSFFLAKFSCHWIYFFCYYVFIFIFSASGQLSILNTVKSGYQLMPFVVWYATYLMECLAFILISTVSLRWVLNENILFYKFSGARRNSEIDLCYHFRCKLTSYTFFFGIILVLYAVVFFVKEISWNNSENLMNIPFFTISIAVVLATSGTAALIRGFLCQGGERFLDKLHLYLFVITMLFYMVFLFKMTVQDCLLVVSFCIYMILMYNTGRKIWNSFW